MKQRSGHNSYRDGVSACKSWERAQPWNRRGHHHPCATSILPDPKSCAYIKPSMSRCCGQLSRRYLIIRTTSSLVNKQPSHLIQFLTLHSGMHTTLQRSCSEDTLIGSSSNISTSSAVRADYDIQSPVSATLKRPRSPEKPDLQDSGTVFPIDY